MGDDQSVVGLVALEDLLEEVIGDFDDETDPVLAAARTVEHRSLPAGDD